MSETAIIGLDWGTSQLRAFRLAADGSVLDRRGGGPGILAVPEGGFPAAFRAFVGDWLDASPTVIAAGMVGSRQGWHEVPYCGCPAGLDELAASVVRVEAGNGITVHFVAGLAFEADNGDPDVMRGEETQVLGVLGNHEGEPVANVLLPGTHSKWVTVLDERIVGFRTYMTGEVFGLLTEHSILARMMKGSEHDPKAFERGVNTGLDQAGGLLGRIFSARSLALFDRLSPGSVHAYLSGLTIGAEIREALRAGASSTAITVIGNDSLATRYVTALACAGIEGRPGATDAAARGLLRIARAGQLPGV